MKKILLIIFTLFLFSCENTSTKVKYPEKETTIEIQQLASRDTTCVNIVEIKDIVYVLNNGIVTHKIENSSGIVKTLLLFILIFLIIYLISSLIKL